MMEKLIEERKKLGLDNNLIKMDSLCVVEEVGNLDVEKGII
jgi:hypothetical protein